MTLWNRRSALAGLGGTAGAALWLPPSADALGLAADKVKRILYYTTQGDAQGRQGQPMVNQSANVVIIETESGLIGIGEGGETQAPMGRAIIGGVITSTLLTLVVVPVLFTYLDALHERRRRRRESKAAASSAAAAHAPGD